MKKDKKYGGKRHQENSLNGERARAVEYVRTQMKIAMLSGMCSGDPAVKARWGGYPVRGRVPTPEELIIALRREI